MVNIRGSEHRRGTSGGAGVGSPSPRGEVGEIDTAAPFQSVKAAVSLFGEVALSRKPTLRKSKLSSENVLDKETQLVLAQREINKYKKQLESAENTKGRVSLELEKAKKTLQDLTTKLHTVTQAKLSAVEAAEAVKTKATKLELEKSEQSGSTDDRKQELDESREKYKISATQLVYAKQQLNQMRQDFDAALDQKLASFQQAAEAQRSANLNSERVSELSKEIKAMRDSAQQLKLAAQQAQELLVKDSEEKDAHIRACKAAKEVAIKSLELVKEEYDPELIVNLEAKLAETSAEIEILQEEMKKAHASEMDAVKVVTVELKEATMSLQLVVEEENSLRDLVTSLKVEVENVKREHFQQVEKEAQRVQLAHQEQCSVLEQILSEAELVRQGAETVKKDAEELKQGADNERLKAVQAEEKLQLVLKEVEMAREAEKAAQDEMKMLSEEHKAQDQDNDSSNNKIKITLEEFGSLKKKVIECENMAETKEAEATMKIEAINASKNDAEKKVEANLKAIEEIKQATDIAVKAAETAAAEQIAAEAELQKLRRQEGQITEA